MPLVHNDLVKKNEGFGRTINQFIEILIKPYYKKRNLKFTKKNFCAALVELYPDQRETKILINQDVPVEIQFHKRKLKKSELGKSINVKLKEIKSISWPSQGLDENSGKVLLLRFNKDYWILNFDFVYNKGNANKTFDRAKEFLSSCKTILRKKEYCPHVLIYLIWSTAELILDTKFLLHAQDTKNNHVVRKNKLEGPLGASFFSPEFSTLLLQLYRVKNPARYADRNFYDEYERKDFRQKVKVLEKEMEIK